MQLSLLPISLLISLAAAQSSASDTTSKCAAQPVLEACLASTQAIAAGCSSTDYGCLCQKNTDILTYVPPSHASYKYLTIPTDVLNNAPTTPATAACYPPKTPTAPTPQFTAPPSPPRPSSRATRPPPVAQQPPRQLAPRTRIRRRRPPRLMIRAPCRRPARPLAVGGRPRRVMALVGMSWLALGA